MKNFEKNNGRFRKVFRFVTVFLLFLLLFSSCGTADDSGEEKVGKETLLSQEEISPGQDLAEENPSGQTVPEEADGRLVLSLGLMDPQWSAMMPQVVEIVKNFNQEQGDIFVNIVYYSDEKGDYDAGLNRLMMDVVSGKAPDIVEATFDYEPFAAKGIFADLYTLMDDEFREQLLPSILKAEETDGKLFALSPAFSMHTIWGKSDVTEGKSGLTLMELLGLLKKHGKDLNGIYGFSTPPLTTFLATSMDEFVNWTEGTCNFTGDEFKEFLTFARDYRGGFYQGGYQSKNIMEAIQCGEIVMTNGMITKVTDHQIEKELYGGDLNYIGLPTQKESGIAAILYDGFAICSGCSHKDAAWEFLKYYIQHYDCWNGFPLQKEAFDKAMDQAMEERLTDEGEICAKDVYYVSEGNQILVYAAAQEDVDAVRELVEKVDTKWQYHTELLAIIEEEASYFFDGEKDIDTVVDIIQNRAALYLQERQ